MAPRPAGADKAQPAGDSSAEKTPNAGGGSSTGFVPKHSAHSKFWSAEEHLRFVEGLDKYDTIYIHIYSLSAACAVPYARHEHQLAARILSLSVGYYPSQLMARAQLGPESKDRQVTG